jgi:hypothetical protein
MPIPVAVLVITKMVRVAGPPIVGTHRIIGKHWITEMHPVAVIHPVTGRRPPTATAEIWTGPRETA